MKIYPLASKIRVLAGASLFAVAVAAAPAQAQSAAPQQSAPNAEATAWGVPLTDVTPDPAIRYGRLANGMKYAIMHNAVPKGGAAVRLHFDFGSLGEKDDERGLAHFIEHMAFNGTKNVPEGEMVRILERQGLKFGPDTNAVTGFDMTMYMLNLPKADEQRVDTALMLMREVAGNVTFDPAAVDRERGVLLGERRARDTFQLHQVTDQLAFMMPQAAYKDRLPIGTAEVIQTAPAERLKSLYQRYYRPENATFVFVGDVDPAEIERKVRETFSDWNGSGEAGADLDPGSVDFTRATEFDTFVDPAAAHQITISSYRPWADPVDDRADRRKELVEALARGMFNRRMQRIVNSSDSVILHGAMSEDENDELALGTSVTVVAKDGSWKEGVQIAEQELRRALRHGFTQAELDLQRAEFAGKLKSAAQQEEARTHAAVAGNIVNAIGKQELVTSPEWNLAFYDQVDETIGLDEVNEAVRDMWSGSPPLVHVASKVPLTGTEVAGIFGQSRQAAVTPPTDEAALEFAYDSFGQPGQIVADTRIADLGTRTIRFANNVKLNIKQTDFEPGKVSYSVRLAGGNVILPKDKPGLFVMASMLSAVAGTEKHSLEDLKTLTAGKQVKPGFIAASDAFISQGTTTSDDLGLQMKLSAAYLTDPGMRPEATAQWKSVSALIDKQFQALPKTLLDTRLPYLLSQGDGRIGMPPGEHLAQRSFAELEPILDQAAAAAPIEVTIVGDIPEQAAIEAVANSFGALPQRQLDWEPAAAVRQVEFRSGGEPILLTHSGDADQALVGGVWRTDDDADYREVVGLDILKEVLDLMLTDAVREQLGASYGVSLGSSMSSTYQDFGYVSVDSVVSPASAEAVDKVIIDTVERLRQQPVDADLLARAKNPLLEEIAKNMRENNYWVAALGEAQSEPERLERIRQRRALVESIDAADLQSLAREFLTPDNMVRVRVVSDKQVGSSAAAS